MLLILGFKTCTDVTVSLLSFINYRIQSFLKSICHKFRNLKNLYRQLLFKRKCTTCTERYVYLCRRSIVFTKSKSVCINEKWVRFVKKAVKTTFLKCDGFLLFSTIPQSH